MGCENAKSVKLEDETVPLVGKKVVTTDKEKQYVLEVVDEFGTKRVPITIKVLPLPLIKAILLPMPKLEDSFCTTEHTISSSRTKCTDARIVS